MLVKDLLILKLDESTQSFYDLLDKLQLSLKNRLKVGGCALIKINNNLE